MSGKCPLTTAARYSIPPGRPDHLSLDGRGYGSQFKAETTGDGFRAPFSKSRSRRILTISASSAVLKKNEMMAVRGGGAGGRSLSVIPDVRDLPRFMADHERENIQSPVIGMVVLVGQRENCRPPGVGAAVIVMGRNAAPKVV